MEFCICPRCAAIYPGASSCPVCHAATVPFDRAHHEELLAAQTSRRMAAELIGWVRDGVIDPGTAEQIRQRLPSPHMRPAV
ncbi:MAG: hypothetical protein EOO75_00415, partial [Myxococcales bacterium]